MEKKVKRGRPQIHPRPDNSAKENLPEEWTRATFIVKEKTLKTIKSIAKERNILIKDLVNSIFEAAIIKEWPNDNDR